MESNPAVAVGAGVRAEGMRPPITISATATAVAMTEALMTKGLRRAAGRPGAVGEGEFFGFAAAVRFPENGDLVQTVPLFDSRTWPGYRALDGSRVLTTAGLRGHLLELARHAVDLARRGGTPLCTGEDGVAALKTAETTLGAPYPYEQ